MVTACMLGVCMHSLYMVLGVVGAIPDRTRNATATASANANALILEAAPTIAMPRGTQGSGPETYGPHVHSAWQRGQPADTLALSYCIVFGNLVVSSVAVAIGTVSLRMKNKPVVARLTKVLYACLCILLVLQIAAISTAYICAKGSGENSVKCTCEAMFCNYWHSMEVYFVFPLILASIAAMVFC